MVTKAITALVDRLSSHLPLSNSRLETFCLLVIGMISARTVNLSHLACEMPTTAKVASTYRRLQRFFQHVDLAAECKRNAQRVHFQPTRCSKMLIYLP